MALQVYAAGGIVRILIEAFLPHRGLALAPRGLAREAEVRAFAEDEIISDMEQFYYVRLDAHRAAPRGSRDWVVILILSATGKYSLHSPDLRGLLGGIEAERAAKEGRLDEVIVVAEEAFFGKKNLTGVVREAEQRASARRQSGPGLGADSLGGAPFYSACPYHNFSYVLPESKIVAPHRVMSAAEVEELLRRERLVFRDLPIIYTDDPPIVWNGGREGQVVEITRDSQTGGNSLYYRRIERGPS